MNYKIIYKTRHSKKLEVITPKTLEEAYRRYNELAKNKVYLSGTLFKDDQMIASFDNENK